MGATKTERSLISSFLSLWAPGVLGGTIFPHGKGRRLGMPAFLHDAPSIPLPCIASVYKS